MTNTVVRFKRKNGDYTGGYVVSCEKNAPIPSIFEDFSDMFWNELSEEDRVILERMQEKWERAEIIEVGDSALKELWGTLEKEDVKQKKVGLP